MPSLLGLPVFEAAPLASVLILFALFFGAYFIKGAVGIGSLTPIVVFGALLIEPHHAVLLALAANVLSQVQFVMPGLRDGDWTVVRQVIVANFAGAALGIFVFGRIDGAALALILGFVLGGIVVADMGRGLERLARRTDLRRPATVHLLSGLAGLVSGVTGAGGLLFLALYLRVVCPDKRTLRGTILLLSTLIVAWRALVMTASGLVTTTVLLETLLLTPAILAGGLAGTRYYHLASEARFAQILQLVVLAGALGLVWRGLRATLAGG